MAEETSWWDSVSPVVYDGFGQLIKAGADRAANEISPPSASEVSQNPNTHAYTTQVGVNADGTPVTSAVPGSGVVAGVSGKHLLLIGGALLLGGAFLLRRK